MGDTFAVYGGHFCSVWGTLSTGLTVCYSFRLVYYSITGDLNCRRLNVLNDEG